jgi:hypothetical protein
MCKVLLVVAVLALSLACGAGSTSFNPGPTHSDNTETPIFTYEDKGISYNLDKGARSYGDGLIVKRITNTQEFKTYLSVTGSDISKADKVDFSHYYVYYLMFKQEPQVRQAINIHSITENSPIGMVGSSNITVEYFYTSSGNKSDYYFSYEAVKRINNIYWAEVTETDFNRKKAIHTIAE